MKQEGGKMSFIKFPAMLFSIFLLACISNNAKIVHKFVDKKVAGIPIGEYSEKLIFKKFGKGILVQEGHAVCYYDRKGDSYLVFEYGPDKFIESGIIIKKDYEKYYHECKAKETAADLRTGKGIKLGDSSESVILIYGEPDKKEIKNGILIFEYHTNSKKDPQVTLAYDAYLHFINDKLVKLFIHDGE